MKYITFEDVLNTYKTREAGIKALSKYHHWFPLLLSPQIAGIVADLMGDGHLQYPKWRMDYTSASIEELERFNREIQKLFGVSSHIRQVTQNKFGKTYLLGLNCNQLGRVMFCCGVPRGAKVLTSFDFPQWISEDKECFRRFIQRLFDCEGTLDVNSPGIELRMWKENDVLENGLIFFETMKSSLHRHFDIICNNIFVTDSNLRKDGKVTRCLRLKIRRMEEFVKFYREIGFETKAKQDKLLQLIQKIEQRKKSGSAGI